MPQVDAATRWSLGLWFVLGLVPTVGQTMGWHKLLEHQGLAAWVQAVGSIGAILGAAFVTRMQVAAAAEQTRLQISAAEQAARRTEELKEVAALDLALTAAGYITGVLEQLREALPGDNLPAYSVHRARLEDGLAIAQSIQIEHLASDHRVALVALRSSAVMVANCIDMVLRADGANAELQAIGVLHIMVEHQLKLAPGHERALTSDE